MTGIASWSRFRGEEPWTDRLRDGVGRVLRRIGLDRPIAPASDLQAAAALQVGHENWGDAGFQEGLEHVVDSLRHNEALSWTGRRWVEGELVGILCRRLRIEAELARRPELAAERIDRPVVITGFPRAGTTLLQRLLAADPGNRSLRFWEAIHPTPLLDDPVADIAHRQRLACDYVDRMYLFHPSLRAAHSIDPLGAEECNFLFAPTFRSPLFGFWAPMREYQDRLLRHDMRPAYGEYFRQLQLLQADRPGGRWVLKAPSHMLGLDALLSTLPDATIVMCHRDPVEVISSTCSLMAWLWARNCDRVDLSDRGLRSLERWGGNLDRGLAIRDAGGPVRFLDVGLRQLVADPIATVGRLYDELGRSLSPAAEEAMVRWLAENPRGQHGVHRHRLEEFGITAEEVRARFGDYYERFAELLG